MYIRNEHDELCCPFCDRKEEHANTLYYHIKRDHDKKFDHPCKHCDHKTYSKSLLDQHIKNKHPESLSSNQIKTFDCVFCSTKSSSKGNLRTHIARTHAPWIQEHKTNKLCQSCGCLQKSSTSYYYHCITCVKPKEGEFINQYEMITKAIK